MQTFDARFNSKLVRLKETADGERGRWGDICFNSKLVRLKVNGGCDFCYYVVRFNSKLVRLKAA